MHSPLFAALSQQKDVMAEKDLPSHTDAMKLTRVLYFLYGETSAVIGGLQIE